MRSAARDGLRNRAEFYALTSFAPAWAFAQRRPVLRRRVNRLLINTEERRYLAASRSSASSHCRGVRTTTAMRRRVRPA